MVVRLSASYTLGTALPSRRKVVDLEDAVRAQPGSFDWEEAEEALNEHYFAPGVYGRMIHMPAGLCVVGKIHKHAHLNIITRGVVRVVTEFGEDTFVGPKVWVSEPGTKRAVYVIEDTDWMTVHHNPSDTQDIREIESEVIAQSFREFDALPGPGDNNELG
jgi:hypothetical protein